MRERKHQERKDPGLSLPILALHIIGRVPFFACIDYIYYLIVHVL